MKTDKLRIVIPLLVLVAAGIAYVAHAEIGTLSAIGWKDIAVLCPIGALTTMLASKSIVPRAVVSLAVALVGIVLLGRAFCAWVCPVPVWGKVRDVFKKRKSGPGEQLKQARKEVYGNAQDKKLTYDELYTLRKARTDVACHAEPSNARHVVLGGTLLSAAVFGFPVFCLVCPIGLSFAGVFTLIMLFGEGDVSWSVVAIPVLLLLETVFFRKWCSHVCPISALMSLVGKLNRTWRPQVEHGKCVENTKGGGCGRCSKVCAWGVDPRHPEWGAGMNECAKCRACVENCPGHAIKMPFISKKEIEQTEAARAAGEK